MKTIGTTMTGHKVVSRGEWIAARKEPATRRTSGRGRNLTDPATARSSTRGTR